MPAVERGLRHAMVDRLITVGCVRGTAVEQAFRTVPRHLFVPGVAPTAAYTDEPIVTGYDADGAACNASSQPSTTAATLEQLAVAPGDRVLEIGTGTGYDAALLAELAGPDGAVTTVEIDPVTAGRARTWPRPATRVLRCSPGTDGPGCRSVGRSTGYWPRWACGMCLRGGSVNWSRSGWW